MSIEYTGMRRSRKHVRQISAETAFVVGATCGASTIASWIEGAAEHFTASDWREFANRLRDREEMDGTYKHLLEVAHVTFNGPAAAVDEMKRRAELI